MAILYFIAILPALIGGALWVFNKQINWIEWAGGSAAGFIIAAIFHLIGVYSIPLDVQTYSGQITQERQFSRWEEYYESAVYRTEYYTVTTGSGKNRHTETRSRQVFDHWRSEHRWHDVSWKMYSNIDTNYDIDESTWHMGLRLFQDTPHPVAGQRSTSEHNSHMIAGDPNDYTATPVSGYVWPITDKRHWENKVRCGPSVFSFVEVPKTIPVFEWPENTDPFTSQRLLGTAAQAVSTYDWDKLNAELGPTKKVNLIAIGFGDKDASIAQYQRAKYIGGKRNDLVICYGGDNKQPAWVVVFGWTDSELVKANLETLVLGSGFTTNTLPRIKEEVMANYKVKDWHAFDHLTTPPSTSLIVWYIVILIASQIGLYIWFNKNEWAAQDL